MVAPAPEPAPSTLQRLFLGRRPARGPATAFLPGGTCLVEVGDEAQALYLVRSGRLAIVRRDSAGRSQILGVVRPGEPVGEMALVGGTTHSAAAVALRDSEVLSLSRERVLREARLHPDLMLELARLMLRRARETPSEAAASAGEPTVFGFVSSGPNAPARPLVERLAAAVRALGRTVGVIGVEALEQPSAWFSRVELDHDLLFLSVESDQTEWRTVAARQLDRLMIVARSGEAPPSTSRRIVAPEAREAGIVDVVLQHAPGGRRFGAQAWSDAVCADRVLHVADGSSDDLARLARVLTGTSVGLVLSGGGARAYAHVGAIQALREAGQPIDFVGGASMGGIVGAGVAMGWGVEELEARIRSAFVKSNPVGDMAWPMVALSRGERVRARLQDHFGDVEFADLGLPFFCVSSNLTTGLSQIHRAGRVRDCPASCRRSCADPTCWSTEACSATCPPRRCAPSIAVRFSASTSRRARRCGRKMWSGHPRYGGSWRRAHGGGEGRRSWRS